MSKEDALRAGEALPLNAQWPGREKPQKEELEEISKEKSFAFRDMRAVANDMEVYLGSMTGASHAEGYTTGSIKSIQENCNLTEAQLGRWGTASAFTQSVGVDCGKKIEEAYGQFIAAYEVTIRIIREQAKVLEQKEIENENL